MNNAPYYCFLRNWPFKILYNEYHYNNYSLGDKPEKIFIVRNNQIIVQGMWRMQLLGELHSGLRVFNYDDNTNWEYYDEVMWQTDSEEDREEFRNNNYHPDTYDEYFEELAGVAAEIGCERAEIKCLIKSLLFKYRTNRIENVSMFPHESFNKLYSRLISSKDIEQLRVAERLSSYHIKQFKEFLRYDILLHCKN